MMEMLNGSAVIVKPRRPYLEWARRDDAEGLGFEVRLSSIVRDLYLDGLLDYIE